MPPTDQPAGRFRLCRAVLRWTFWTFLGATALVQIFILLIGEVGLPQSLRLTLREQLARQGVEAAFTTATLNPSGLITFTDLRLTAPGLVDPLLTARFVQVRVRPWDLLGGGFPLRAELAAEDLDLKLPALRSPTGATEAVVTGARIRLVLDHGRIIAEDVSGRVDNLTVTARAHFDARLLSAPRFVSPDEPRVNPLRVYLDTAARFIANREHYRQLGPLHLDLDLQDRDLVVRLLTGDLDLSRLTATGIRLPPFKAGRLDVRLSTALRTSAPVSAEARLGHLELDGQVRLEDVALRTTLPAFDLSTLPGRIDLTAARILAREVVIDSPSLELHPRGDDALDAALVARIAGADWTARFSGNPVERSGRLDYEGAITPAMLAAAGSATGLKLRELLAFTRLPRLAGSVTLSSGGRPASASLRLRTGPVNAHGVRLDETAGDLAWSGTTLRIDDILLKQGDSLARGSYEMDTATRDYRFLLAGTLRPEGIAGWFHGWWTRFWANFDFRGPAPAADVDVRGRWGSPYLSTVYVAADGAEVSLRGAALDRVRTRIFLRPLWYDILAFEATLADGAASGAFTRSVDAARDEWSRMTFDVVSTLPLSELAAFFGEDGKEFLEPYTSEHPPSIRAVGEVHGPGSDRDGAQHIDLAVNTRGGFTYSGFGLADLALEGRIRDRTVELSPMRAGFAGGVLSGRAVLTGPEGRRRLAIDHELKDANLVDASGAVLARTAAKEGRPPPDLARMRERLGDGRLDLVIKAEGPYDDLMAFNGEGEARIRGAQLAHIRLFGWISDALTATGLGFSSLSLENAHARFHIEGERVRLDDIRVTGPSASVDASGVYDLATRQLDFEAKLRPFDKASNLIGNTVDLMLSPLTHLLEVRITGTPDKPSWTFAYGPGALLRPREENPPAAPPATSAPGPGDALDSKDMPDRR